MNSTWAAQRVPDGHFTIAPNVMIIREIDFKDTANFKWASNMIDVAVAMGK